MSLAVNLFQALSATMIGFLSSSALMGHKPTALQGIIYIVCGVSLYALNIYTINNQFVMFAIYMALVGVYSFRISKSKSKVFLITMFSTAMLLLNQQFAIPVFIMLQSYPELNAFLQTVILHTFVAIPPVIVSALAGHIYRKRNTRQLARYIDFIKQHSKVFAVFVFVVLVATVTLYRLYILNVKSPIANALLSVLYGYIYVFGFAFFVSLILHSVIARMEIERGEAKNHSQAELSEKYDSLFEIVKEHNNYIHNEHGRFNAMLGLLRAGEYEELKKFFNDAYLK